jgi:serine/threonine protein kinase
MSQIVQKDFFISYTSADSRWAEWMAWQLEEAGYSVILQAWDFRPGANFVSEMERAISHVKRTIAVLSPQYLNALYTQPEWAAAFRRDPKGEQGILVPVRIQECEVTGLLGQIIYVDLVGRDEVSAAKILLAGVRHERAKPELARAFPERVLHTVSKQLSFPGDLPSIWNVPYPRDPLFVGHEQVLQELHSILNTKHQAALTLPSAASDLRKVGVIETALEYVYRYQSDYHIILWAHANSRQTLLSDFVDIASLLNLPEKIAQRQDEMVNRVKRCLQTQTHWLLVLEDVQDPEVIHEFIPSLNRGSLLLTTRVPSVSQLFPRVEMDRMKPEEQTLLLQLSRMVGATLRSSQRRMPLGIERITIGRAQDNQVVLNDPAVSSHHAEILLKEQGYWVTDVGSSNGTFVNQQVLERHVPYLLHPRDVIRISNTTFTFEVNDTASSKLLASSLPATVHTPSDQHVLPSSSGEAHVGEHVGKQLGNYRLERLIGQGGFAEVYLAEHIHLDTIAAIKLLFTKLAKDDIEAFRQEARTIARLVHPHIVRVLDFGVEGTTPFLVMDYAPGDTLRQLHPKGTRLPLETVVTYVKQVALALQYAHEQKVIHRDVKPENMLMGRNGEVLLSDFGIALITQSSRYESSIDMAGTIAYMAPEQIEANPRQASDQYSLGIVVYEWLTGDRPFHGTFREIAIKHSLVPPPSLCEQVPTLPPAVEQVVLIALAKEPKQRFGNVLAFATAFEQASQVKQPEPKSVVPISETTATNQSRQSTEMAIPVIPFSQQTMSEVSADTPAQPQTIIPSPGEEGLRQTEEESRQSEEEKARQEKEQADKIEEERVRKAKDTALAQAELATAAHQTPLPTEVAHSSKPPVLRPDAMVAVKPAKPSTSRRFVLLVLAGLVIVALASGIAWFTIHHASSAGSITEFPLAANSGPWEITAGPGGSLWFTECGSNKIGRISTSGSITEFPVPPPNNG